jgi:putative endonuclease
MSFYVYFLISHNKKRTISYVGYTKDLKKRVKLHNSSKGAKFTKGRKWVLIYNKRYKSKSIAMKEEYKLKKNYKLRSSLKNDYLIKI